MPLASRRTLVEKVGSGPMPEHRAGRLRRQPSGLSHVHCQGRGDARIALRAELAPLLNIAIATTSPHGVKNPVLRGRTPMNGAGGRGIEGRFEGCRVEVGGWLALSLMPMGQRKRLPYPANQPCRTTGAIAGIVVVHSIAVGELLAAFVGGKPASRHHIFFVNRWTNPRPVPLRLATP